MSFVVVAKLRAKPECIDQLRNLIVETAKSSWLESGLIKYILITDSSQLDLFTLVEFFETESAYHSHRDSDHLASFRIQVAELLAADPEVVRGVPQLAELNPKAGIN